MKIIIIENKTITLEEINSLFGESSLSEEEAEKKLSDRMLDIALDKELINFCLSDYINIEEEEEETNKIKFNMEFVILSKEEMEGAIFNANKIKELLLDREESFDDAYIIKIVEEISKGFTETLDKIKIKHA